MLRPAVFLDRAGTIREDVCYLNHASGLRIFPSADGAIRILKQEGTRMVVLTEECIVAGAYSGNSTRWILEQTR